MEATEASLHQKCIVCNGAKLKDLEGYEGVGLCQCKNCGMVFVRQIPTLQVLSEHYKNYTYDRNVFVSPITIQRYNEILDGFEKYRSANTLLDIGCGVGLFLEVAIKRGWNVYGTEYSEKAIEIAESKGIKMKKGALNPKVFEDIKFDVITSFEVIEHINNPQQEMKSIMQLLRAGGLFYCTTPNFNALSRYYLKAHYSVIEYPEHLSYYTPKTLKYLCKKEGLQPLKVITTGLSLTRLSPVGINQGSITPPTSTSADEQVRRKIESNMALRVAKEFANKIFTWTGTGYSLKGYFIKPLP
jgi:2-polyprenyl-3-methyl-5-hydroxy-6-metoxy-1,4-benzoquinol methylase